MNTMKPLKQSIIQQSCTVSSSCLLLTLSDEKVEQRDDGRVTTEHVVATRPHSLNGHAKLTQYFK